jgi:hypothetical protein
MTKHHEALPRPGQGGTAAVTLFALACMAPSAGINVMHQLAYTPGALALPLAAASVLSVALAAASPFAIERAIATRNAALLLVALLTGGVCLTYNLAAALGAASTTRAEIAGSRTAENRKAALLTGQLAQYEQSRSSLASISQEKTPGVIEAELRGLEQSPAWTSSKQCTDATLLPSRQLCTNRAGKQAALDASRKVEALDREIGRIKAQLLASSGHATGQPADTQAANLAAALSFIGGSVQPENIGVALNLWLAVLIEIIGAFGPLVFASVLRRQPQPAEAVSVEQSAAVMSKGKAKTPASKLRRRSKKPEAGGNIVDLAERKEAVADLQAEGMTQLQIAAELGVSRSTVQRAVKLA